MTESWGRLLTILANGECHSGEALGVELGVSRAAIWKQIQAMAQVGIHVESVRGAGYCLPGGMSLLSEGEILKALEGMPAGAQGQLQCVVYSQLDSTNERVLQRIRAGESGHGYACLAELQTAGRGRRGRQWQSPYGRNVYLSLGWRFERGVAAMEGLSLAIGVAVCRALDKNFSLKAELKWPNDVLLAGRKLGGILLEVAGDLSGECYVVAGVGLNVSMPSAAAQAIDQPWIDVASCIESEGPIERNQLAAALLFELSCVLSDYEQRGFAAYKNEWKMRCPHIGASVQLSSHSNTLVGEMVGVDDTGALLLLVDGELKPYSGGELSLRLTSS